MILPNDPADLKTDYVLKDSDITWTRNVLNEDEHFRLWATSDASYFVVPLHKVVALASYNENYIDPNMVLDNIARFKIGVEACGWNFGYDKVLQKTMKIPSDVDKHTFLAKEINRIVETDVIDIEKAARDVSEFLVATNIYGQPRTDPKYFKNTP